MSTKSAGKAVMFIAVGLVAGACSTSAKAPDEPHRSERSVVSSNVRFVDYAGSSGCAACHQEIADKFARSPMHRMTRDITSAELSAKFDGFVFRMQGDVATMFSESGRRYLKLQSKKQGDHLFRLSEVIGGRYREDFVGIEVQGTGTAEGPIGPTPIRQIMPVSWVIGTKEWRYKGYSVQLPERHGLQSGPNWAKTCVFCHNTIPFLTISFDEIGSIDRPYQGHTPSNLLGPSRRLRFTIDDPNGLAASVREELERIEADKPDASSSRALLESAMRETYAHFDRKDVVELGIGCESCHGGSREHVKKPSLRPSFVPTTSLFSVRDGDGPLSHAASVNHACARCHSVLFSQYPHTWEGGSRRDRPGGSTINSGEARDFLLGACSRQLACTACHDPHGEDDRQKLAALATPAGNRVCTPCHAKLGDEAALRRHSHHDPKGEGGSCIACHMPMKNTGLGYGLTRYHRIGLPTDPARVEKDRPIECALCHTEKTVDELVTTIEKWTKRRYDRGALQRLYGDDLRVNALEATLTRGWPHERTVAIDRLGRSKDPRHAKALIAQIPESLPITRYFVREALMRLTGKRPELDMALPGEELAQQADAWLDSLK
jgi:predicted CXXCH cytochrome family protein